MGFLEASSGCFGVVSVMEMKNNTKNVLSTFDESAQKHINEIKTLGTLMILRASLATLVFTTAAGQFFSHRRFGGIDHPVNVVLKNLEEYPPQNAEEGGAPPVNASFFNAAVLDHFSGLASPTLWSQRFYIDDRFWGGAGSPVFLYIGGEGPQGPPSSRLFMWTLAEEHGALMLALEHRFYGESQPTPDMSVSSLRYLSSEQALSDLSNFVAYVKAWVPSGGGGGGGDGPAAATTPPLGLSSGVGTGAPWVTFGGSYPGSLATWLKVTNPALVTGTVGSSAPVFSIYDFSQYAQVCLSSFQENGWRG